MSQTIIAYGYRRATDHLDHLGAGKHVYIDHDALRRLRTDMIKDLRPGDIVRVLYLRDLGGSPVADRKYVGLIESKGATVEECRPEKPTKPMGRPRKFNPTPEQEDQIRAVWLDPARSLADKCQGVIDIYGSRVPRFTLYRLYGSSEKPKTKEQSDGS